MFCSKCGASIDENSKFCTNCGAPVNKVNEVIEEAEIVNSEVAEEANTETIVPYVNKTESIKEDFEEDDGTEIVFDKKLPTDRLKKNNNIQTLITIAGIVLAIGVASIVIIINNQKIKQLSETGFVTTSDNKIKYNKGNNTYAKDEIIEDKPKEFYYFDNNEELVKDQWVYYRDKWYLPGTDGKFKTSSWVGENNYYYVNEYGEMLVNTRTPDNFLVDENGRWIDEAALKQAEEASKQAEEASKRAEEAARKKHSGGDYRISTTAYYTPPSTGVVPGSGYRLVTNPDTTKEIYIYAYDNYVSYVEYDDNTTVDISIDYPIFAGANTTEIASINAAMKDCLSGELENNIDSDIYNKTGDNNIPIKANINEATIQSIESNKIYVLMKGNLEIKGKSSKKLNYKFVYERDYGRAYIQ